MPYYGFAQQRRFNVPGSLTFPQPRPVYTAPQPVARPVYTSSPEYQQGYQDGQIACQTVHTPGHPIVFVPFQITYPLTKYARGYYEALATGGCGVMTVAVANTDGGESYITGIVGLLFGDALTVNVINP